MIKLFKNWLNLFREIDNQELIKQTNKKLDIFTLIFTTIFIGIPYFICLFTAFMVLNKSSIACHLFIWSIAVFTPVYFASWYLFMYKLLKCYYEDNALLNSTTSIKVFLGSLLNPLFWGFGVILSIMMEILI